mgnify:CR=1 FL=1
MLKCDIAIVGGGIVGLATAYRLAQANPQLSLAVIEKEPDVGQHQTGHNSGVLHSGIYYKPGSLKAINCRQGKIEMERFCAEHGIPYDVCGKVIVAVDRAELPLLDNIFQRGQANGVRCEMIDVERLRELEPHAAGIQAIHVPEAGIVNYRAVCLKLAELLRDQGHQVVCGAPVKHWRRDGSRTVLATHREEVSTRLAINCAGLHCDRVMTMAGEKPRARIVPFRGEYYELTAEAQHLCRHLIYPVPDPKFPFLGVHFTRMIDGGIECGPNAVLAFAREGYTKWRCSPRDLIESLTYPGFVRMALRHWRKGCGEMWRSLNKHAFVRALQRLLPSIESRHLRPAPAGVRAQAVTWDGALVDDFLIVETEHAIHVNNAPSPAATASLNIGQLIADKALPRFQ